MSELSWAERTVQGAWFTILGRFAMVFVAGAAPIAGSMLWGIQQGQFQLDKKLEVGQAKTDAKIEAIQATLTALTSGRYTTSDAQRDFALRDLKLDTLSTRLQDLEHELRRKDGRNRN